MDLVVANDSTPNYFYINKGDGAFEDVSLTSGYAFNQDGREIALMGIAIGGYQNTGRLSLFNTDFSDDYKVLYRNDGEPVVAWFESRPWLAQVHPSESYRQKAEFRLVFGHYLSPGDNSTPFVKNMSLRSILRLLGEFRCAAVNVVFAEFHRSCGLRR